MKRVKKVATLSDVAKVAGVSPYTVSVVLNGSRSNTRVSEATRQRILESAADLQYYPNAMARALVHRHAQALGVLFGVVEPTVVVSNPYAAGLLEGILAAAADFDYSVNIFTARWVDATASAARYRDGRTDGIIVIAPPDDSDILAGLASHGLTLSVIAGPGARYGLPTVDVDNDAGVRLAVDHLVSLGHRRIAHLTGNVNMSSTKARLAAFRQALTGAGFGVRAEYIATCRYDGDTVEPALRRLMSLESPPTALVAGNDTIALAAMNACREMGISIPNQLSLVGFDDVQASSMVTPSLTTIRQPLREIGARAACLLIDQAEGRSVLADEQLLVPKLIIRGTTAPVVS